MAFNWYYQRVQCILKNIGIFTKTSIDWFHGRNVVVFYIPLMGQIPYIQPIIQELLNRHEKVSIYLVVDDQLEFNRCSLEKLTKIPAAKTIRWSQHYAIFKIAALVSATQWIPSGTTARIRICMFHGQPSKGNTFLPHLMHEFNVLFFIGPLHSQLYEKFATQHPIIAKKIETFNVGYPKSDRLINGVYSRCQVLKELNIEKASRVILYAPAFDAGASLDMYGEEIIITLLATGATLLVKLHPMCYDTRYFSSGGNWTDRLKLFEKEARFRHIGNEALDPYLVASEVLVTDVSGSGFEFIMLGKPVVFIDSPDFNNEVLGNNLNYPNSKQDVLQDIHSNAGRNLGLVVTGLSFLQEAVTRSLEFPAEYSKQRQAIRAQLLYNPGKAGHVATNYLLNLIKKSDD